MPIYEYRCLDCDSPFEVFARRLDDGDARCSCPSCEGTRTRKEFSVFSSSVAPSQSEAGGCGTTGCCGGGGCAVN